MIRVLSRVYSTGRRKLPDKKGCRLLDYVSPATHSVVPRPSYLLGSRTGHRYQNQTLYEDEEVELATIWVLLRHRASQGHALPRQWHNLRDKLGLDPMMTPSTFIPQELKSKHIRTWVSCLNAPDIGSALTMILSHASIPWPPFVVLHTFGRHGRSPLNAYNAMRVYELVLPSMAEHIQPELVTLMLRLAQKHLVDLIPSIIRIYLDVLKRAGADSGKLSGPVVNELLWQIARYGKHWSDIDIPLLLEAQEMLVLHAGTDKVDAKGMFALAYVTHFKKPDVARQFMDDMKSIAMTRTLPQNASEFAYANGPAVIKLLTSHTAEQALAIIDQVQTNLPAMWSCAALYLTRKKFFEPGVAMRLWKRCIEKRVRITALLTELVIGAQTSFKEKYSVLSTALAAGLKLNPSLVAKMVNVNTKQDLETAISHFPQFMDHPLVLEKIMNSQCYCDPSNMWTTYSRLHSRNTDGPPSRMALRILCRAAWDPALLWDGMYASQRALAEVKMHVRGAAAPADDLLRVYPDESLLYAYLVMVGRAGYQEELLGFLSWMDDLKFEPTKRMLLALIHYSPQGPALLKLGQKTKPPASNWPTQEEYELYRNVI